MAEADPPPGEKPTDLDFAQARLAYSIIQSLLEHTRVVSDLIALMAQTLDEDTTKALTQTPVIKAVRVGNPQDIARGQALEPVADILLFDARVTSPGALPGGNGVSFDCDGCLTARLGEILCFPED